MTQSRSVAALTAVACAAALAAQTSPVNACSRWHACERERAQVQRPRYYRDDADRGGIRYYRANPCPYGDCACIRGYALSTGSEVWWDRYQACTGG